MMDDDLFLTKAWVHSDFIGPDGGQLTTGVGWCAGGGGAALGAKRFHGAYRWSGVERGARRGGGGGASPPGRGLVAALGAEQPQWFRCGS
jgi:hypothetical protein